MVNEKKSFMQRMIVALELRDGKTIESAKKEISYTLLSALIESRQIGFKEIKGDDGIITIQGVIDVDSTREKQPPFYME